MEAVEMAEIDLVKYGALWERVQGYERRFDEMSVKIDKLETNIEHLVALANQGRGGFWAGMAFVSLISSAIGFGISLIKGH
jgi:hypothetical protein